MQTVRKVMDEVVVAGGDIAARIGLPAKELLQRAADKKGVPVDELTKYGPTNPRLVSLRKIIGGNKLDSKTWEKLKAQAPEGVVASGETLSGATRFSTGTGRHGGFE